MEHSQPEFEGARPDPWIAWLNAAPAGTELPVPRHRLDGGALILALCGVAFWGAVAWAGYSLLA